MAGVFVFFFGAEKSDDSYIMSKKEGNLLFLGGARWGSWPLSQSPEPADPDLRTARQPDVRDGGRSLSRPRPDDPVPCIAQAGEI